MGLEILLYEDAEIDYSAVLAQIAANGYVEGNEIGTIYVYLRGKQASTGDGFGRSGDVAITANNHLSALRFRWNEPGAAVPTVNPQIALNGLLYTDGLPSY